MSAEIKRPSPSENGTVYNGNGAGHDGYQGTGGGVSRFITPGGNPIDNSQPAFPVYHRKFANPAPLGLLGFAGTTFVLSMVNARVRGITVPNIVVGLAYGYGGLVQLIAGVEEWACGNTFGATAFSSYGGFWISYAIIQTPFFRIATAYGDDTRALQGAIGIYLISWALITLIFLIACLRSSVALVALFACLDVTFWLLAAGELAPSVNTTRAGGVFGVVTAFIAMYTALAGMLTKDTSHFLLPVGDLSRSRKNQ